MRRRCYRRRLWRCRRNDAKAREKAFSDCAEVCELLNALLTRGPTQRVKVKEGVGATEGEEEATDVVTIVRITAEAKIQKPRAVVVIYASFRLVVNNLCLGCHNRVRQTAPARSLAAALLVLGCRRAGNRRQQLQVRILLRPHVAGETNRVSLAIIHEEQKGEPQEGEAYFASLLPQFSQLKLHPVLHVQIRKGGRSEFPQFLEHLSIAGEGHDEVLPTEAQLTR